MKGDERKEKEEDKEAARLWISGIEAVKRKLGVRTVYDLSATPFFLQGSGYIESTLFPWTISDFSLIDAIECGIVKLPRVPIADNLPSGEAVIDSYNPTGSTAEVNFNTTKPVIATDPRKCHVNAAVSDSHWEDEFCRVAEAHPRVRAYVKNHNLGFEIFYLLEGEPRRYRPDFIVQLDDGREDPLNLIVEVKGYRGEDAKTKKQTAEQCWVPSVNATGRFGRWAFVELTEPFTMRSKFDTLVGDLCVKEAAE